LHLKASDDDSLGDHMVDMRPMAGLKVRSAFERYGASAYFRNRQITGIYWSHGKRFVQPCDEDWEHVKYAWRASLFTWITAVDHLVFSHMIISNGINAAIRESLPTDHPIRRVLHVNKFGTSRVNSSATITLATEGCFLHRMSSFEWKGGLRDALVLGAKSFKFQTWPERVAESDLPPEAKEQLPLFTDGLLYWEALREFYGEYVDMYYEDDAQVLEDAALVDYWRFRCTPQYGPPSLCKEALKDQLTHACFGVTAWHQIAGDVVQYVTDPKGMFFQIRPGQVMADAEEMSNVMSLTASTGRDMPLFREDWSHLLEDKCKEAWGRLQVRLDEVSEAVESRNRARERAGMVPYTELDPRYFECSVSI